MNGVECSEEKELQSIEGSALTPLSGLVCGGCSKNSLDCPVVVLRTLMSLYKKDPRCAIKVLRHSMDAEHRVALLRAHLLCAFRDDIKSAVRWAKIWGVDIGV